MIIHQVFFWLKDPHHASARNRLMAGIRAMAVIPEIRALRVGTAAGTESRDVVDASFDVSETMEFASLADQKTYQDHPLHRAFAQSFGHLWDRVVVYDIAVPDSDS